MKKLIVFITKDFMLRTRTLKLKPLIACTILACGVLLLIFELGYPRQITSIEEKATYANCTLFYIDVGTNIGVQIRKLYEPSRYPNAPVLAIFDKYFGDRRGEVCAIGIELNPSHTSRLIALESHYRADCGYNVKIFTETAASARNEENTTFWSDNAWDHLEWGASIHKTANHVDGTPQIVKAMNLARFLREEIIPHARTIVMKLDVEGAEREILPHLVLSGALCSIDLAFMELHSLSFSQQDNINVQNTLALFPHASAMAGCKTVISLIDDETFLHDADPTLNTC